jgi:hypothetical protein
MITGPHAVLVLIRDSPARSDIQRWAVELPVGTDADEVIRHVGAPLYYRLLVLAEPLSGEAADLAAAVATTAAKAGVFVHSSQSTDRKSSQALKSAEVLVSAGVISCIREQN